MAQTFFSYRPVHFSYFRYLRACPPSPPPPPPPLGLLEGDLAAEGLRPKTTSCRSIRKRAEVRRVALYIYSAAISHRRYQKALRRRACRYAVESLPPANFILCLANQVSARGEPHRVLFMNKSLFMRRITRRRHNAAIALAFIVVLYLRRVSD